MGRKPGAVDVAQAAGVSPATVDRVLNDRGGVSLRKQKLVLEWANKLGLDRNLKRRPSRIARVGIIMPEPSNPFYESLTVGFAKANRIFFSANMQNVIYHADIFAHAEKAALIKSLSRTHDALIIVSAENSAVTNALRVVSSSIPIVTIASDLPESGRLAYVGPNNYSAGRVAADLIGRLVGPQGGAVLVMSGHNSLVCHGERETGFRSALAELHPACQVIGAVESGEQRNKTGEIIREVLQKHSTLKGIYNISSGNRDLANMLRYLRRDQDIVLITHELTADRRELLRAGIIDAIIDQNPEMEAIIAVETLAHHFGRVEVTSASPATPFTLHFRENC